MTPMSEIAKCRCGARAHLQGHVDDVDGEFVSIACYDGKCGWTSPWRRTEPEAIAAWNDLMRPRPVARWGAFVLGSDRGKFSSGSVTLGEVTGAGNHWVARCYLTDETRECANPWYARAWLEERVRAAGFDVREKSSRA